jgi:hypothetical protein
LDAKLRLVRGIPAVFSYISSDLNQKRSAVRSVWHCSDNFGTDFIYIYTMLYRVYRVCM